MAVKHLSMRGELLDMERLRLSNAEQVALGNANKNARGDQLGPGGVIIRTQEQIEAEWEALRLKKEAQSKAVNIKQDDGIQRALDALAPKAKKITSEDANFEPTVENTDTTPITTPTVESKPAVQRRRIVDNN